MKFNFFDNNNAKIMEKHIAQEEKIGMKKKNFDSMKNKLLKKGVPINFLKDIKYSKEITKESHKVMIKPSHVKAAAMLSKAKAEKTQKAMKKKKLSDQKKLSAKLTSKTSKTKLSKQVSEQVAPQLPTT